MPAKLQSSNNKVWKKQELDFIKTIKEHPALYSRRKPSKAPLMKIWKSVAQKLNMSIYECKSKWEYWQKYYVSVRKQQLNGVKTFSKFLDGTLSFLDKENEELQSLIRLKKVSAKEKTVTVLSINTIDELLKERDDDPDIDPAIIEYLFNILTDRIEIVLKSGEKMADRAKARPSKTAQFGGITQIEKSIDIEKTVSVGTDNSLVATKSNIYEENFARTVKAVNTTELPQTVETTQTSTIKPTDSNNSDNIKNRTLTVRRPDTINMDSIISSIASQALQNTSSSDRNINQPAPQFILNKETRSTSQQVENESIDIDDDQVDATESLPSTSNLDELDTAKSTEMEDFDTVFDLHCRRKDPRLFFKDLAEYIIDKFSPAKQKEIRLKICSIVTEAELEEME